jgi:hypothetical protein
MGMRRSGFPTGSYVFFQVPANWPTDNSGWPQVLSVVLSKLGRGEGRDCIDNRLNAARSRDRDKGVPGE